MKPIQLTNQIYIGANQRKSVYDLSIPDSWNGKIIVFIHGYMGYKDWGCWNLVQAFFNRHEFGFVKYNVSHNGGTTDQVIDFNDLDAFAQNSYLKEVADFNSIIELISEKVPNKTEICVIGHSRGGGIALLHSNDARIHKIATWASISSIEDRFPKNEALSQWKTNGVYYRENSRTKQQMPHNYDQYIEFLKFKDRLNIQKHCINSTIPTLVIHGDADTSVPIHESKKISSWLKTNLCVIRNANHTFGSSQPWIQQELPDGLEEVCAITAQFFSTNEAQRAENAEKMSLLKELVKLANSDKNLRQSEFDFLSAIAIQLEITPEEFKYVFESNISFQPPKLEGDRILQFQRLILMMHVDESVDDNQLRMIRELGIRMGLNPLATNKVLEVMNDYENGIVPPEKLIHIFQSYHN